MEILAPIEVSADASGQPKSRLFEADVEKLTTLLVGIADREVRENTAPQLPKLAQQWTKSVSTLAYGSVLCASVFGNLYLVASSWQLPFVATQPALGFGLAVIVTIAIVGSLLHFSNAIALFARKRRVARQQIRDLSRQYLSLLKERKTWLDRIQATKRYVNSVEADRSQSEAALEAIKLEVHKLTREMDLARDSFLDLSGQRDELARLEREEYASLEACKLELRKAESELVDKRKSVESLNDTVNELKRSKVDIESQLEESSGQLAVIKNQQSEVSVDLSGLTASRDSLVAELHELRRQIDGAQHQSSNLSSQVSANQDALNELNDQLKIAEHDRALLITDLETRRSEREAALRENELLACASARCKESVIGLEADINDLNSKRDIALSELGIAIEHLNQVRDQQLELVNQVLKGEADLQHIAHSLALQEAKQRQIDESITTKEECLQSLIDEVESSESHAALLLGRIGELERLTAAKDVALSDAETVFTRLLQSRSELDAVTQEVSSLRDEVTALQASRDSINEDIQSITEQRSKLIDDTSISEESLRTLEASRFALECMLESKTKELGEIEDGLREATSAVVAAKSELESLLANKREAEKAVADAQRRAIMLGDRANAYAEQVEKKSSEMLSLKQEAIALRAEMRELNEAKKRLEESQQTLDNVSEAISVKSAELASMTEKLEIEALRYEVLLAEIAEREQINVVKNSELDELLRKVSQHECSIIETIKQNEALEAERAKLESAVESLAQEIENLELVRHDRGICLQEFDDELVRLRHTRELYMQEIDVMSNSILELQARIARYESEAAELENTRERHLELIETVSLLELAVDDLTKQREAADVHLAEVNAQIDKSVGTQETLAEKLQELEQQCVFVSERLQSISEEVADAQNVSCQWTAYIDSLGNEVKELESRKLGGEAQIVSVEQQMETKLFDLEQASLRIQRLQDDEQDLKARKQDSVASLQGIVREIETANGKLEDLFDSERRCQQRLSEYAGQVGHAEAELRSVQLRIEDEKIVLVDYQTRAESLQHDVSHLESEIVHLKSERIELKAESTDLQVQLEKSQKLIDERRFELDGLDSEISRLQGSLNDLVAAQGELQQVTTALGEASHLVESKRSEIVSLESSLQKLVEAFGEKQSEFQELAVKGDAKASEIHSLERGIDELREKHEVLQESNLQLEEQNVLLKLVVEETETRQTLLDQVELELTSKRAELCQVFAQIEQSKLLINEQQKQSAQIENELIETDSVVKHRQAEFLGVQAALAQARAELNDLGNQHSELMVSLENVNSEFEARSALVSGISSQVSVMSDRLLQLAEEVSQKVAEHERLSFEISRIESSMNVRSSALVEIENSIAVHLSKVSQLSDSARALSIAREAAELELDEKANETVELADTLAKLCMERDSMQQFFADLGPRIQTLTEQCDLLESKKATLEREIAEMSSDRVPPRFTTRVQALEAGTDPIEIQIWDSVVEMSRTTDSLREDAEFSMESPEEIKESPAIQSSKSDAWAIVFE